MKKEKKEKTLAQELTEQFTRHTGILLEQIRSENRVVADGHVQLTRQMEELKEDVNQLKENVEQGFIGVRSDIHKLKSDVQELKSDVHGLKSEIQEFKSEMQEFKVETGQRFDRLENTFGSIAQDHEKRITKVEEKLAV